MALGCTVCGEPGGVLPRCPLCGATDSVRTREAARGPLPRVAERYELLDLIAVGGMGRVYRALQHPLDRAVAIKFIDATLPEQEALVARFLLEAQAASRVRHPNVVTVVDFGRTPFERGGVPYLVMELLSGPSLARLIERGAVFSTGEAVDVVRQLLGALGEAHRQGVLHRDVKPENVLLEPRHPDGHVVKLIDFGVARISEDQALTPFGVHVGTIAYMAPEAAEGHASGPAADLYAAGLILFELLAGDRPFEPGDARPLRTGTSECVTRHGGGAAPDPRAVARDRVVPDALAEVCMRALDPEPARRFASADEFADALASALARSRSASRRVPSRALPLVARGADVEWALRRALASPPQPSSFAGATGSGRTRLLVELRDRIAERAHRAVLVEAPPWPAGGVAGAGVASVVAALDAPRGPRLATTDDAARALAAALKHALAATKGRRLAVLLDDVDQWDELSQAALAELFARATRLDVALVTSSLEPLAIDALGVRGVRALTRSEADEALLGTGVALPDAAPRALVPAYLEHLVRWSAEGAAEAPRDLVSLAAERVRARPFAEGRVLKALAVLGSATHELIADVAQLEGGIDGALASLAEAGMVRMVGAELRVAGAAVAHVVLGNLAPVACAALHERAAEALASRGAPPELVALHERESAPPAVSLAPAPDVARAG